MTCIIVAFPKKEDAVSIRNILVRNGYEVAAVCTGGGNVMAAADGYNEGIVVCGCKLADMTYAGLREILPSSFELLVLASPGRLEEGLSDGVVNVSMPVKIYDFISTIEMMSSAIERKRRKRRETPRSRNPREQKLIDDAKSILMERNNMSEPEAHRYIQKLSMDSGTNIVETAEMIIMSCGIDS